MSEAGHNSGVSADELKQLIERIERFDEEIAGLNADKSDVFKEAKGRGFDVKAMRKILAVRRKDHATYQEEQAIFELYAQALGMAV